MANHCQMAGRSGSSKRQNLAVVTPLKAKKGVSQLQTKDLIRVVTRKMCLFSLYYVKYMIFITGTIS